MSEKDAGPSSTKQALARSKSAVKSGYDTVGIVKNADKVWQDFASTKGQFQAMAGGTTRLFVVMKAQAIRHALSIASTIVPEKDRGAVTSLITWVNPFVSCGTLLAYVLATGVTGGAAIAFAATSALACGRDAFNAFTANEKGEGYFDRTTGLKVVSLSIDAANLVTGLITVSGTKSFQLLGKGLTGRVGGRIAELSAIDRLYHLLNVAGQTLTGMAIIVEVLPDGTARELPADPDSIRELLQIERLRREIRRYCDSPRLPIPTSFLEPAGFGWPSWLCNMNLPEVYFEETP